MRSGGYRIGPCDPLCRGPAKFVDWRARLATCQERSSGRLRVDVAAARSRRGSARVPGFWAWQILRPCWMRLTCASYIWSGSKHAEEQVVRQVDRRLRRQQADPLRDPLDVPVDRHERHAEAEQQHDRGRLLADPVDARQPRARVERRHLRQELQRVVAALLADPPQRGLEARRLLVGEAARADDVRQLGDRGELDRAPVGRRALRAGRSRPSRPPG